LVRAEHLFFGEERLQALLSLILVNSQRARKTLEQLQAKDFLEFFEAAGSQSIGFRLLDAPLYEFLPHQKFSIEALAESLDLSFDECQTRIMSLQPIDSLMAVRAVRLLNLRPEIEAIQVKALVTAYQQSIHSGLQPGPLTIIIPMLCGGEETRVATQRIRDQVAALEEEYKIDTRLKITAMIEIPRAALEADRIARLVDWLAWGTNDLSQFATGMGRNVSDKIAELHEEIGIEDFCHSQFDPLSVFPLMQCGQALAKRDSPSITSGVCGAHATQYSAIKQCFQMGIDYISVPASQVTWARFAVAKAKAGIS